MAGVFQSSEEDLIAGINVTPLVDIVLVLLIIFLITAPVIYQTSLKIHLAKASTGETADQSSSINLAVTKTGEVLWNNQPVGKQALEQRLKDMGSAASSKTAIISADQETPHGTVIQLMDTLRRSGVEHLALNVEQTSAPKSR